VLLIAAPFLATGPDYLLQSLQEPVIRLRTWETVWALIDGYYSYGVAGGVDRFDRRWQVGAAPHPTAVAGHHHRLLPVLPVPLYPRRVDWRDARRVVAFTALPRTC